MLAGKESNSAATTGTVVKRTSERELVVTRTFDAPARIVFEAWSKADLFQRWWIPKAMSPSLLSCDIDMRTGGGYRLVFRFPGTDEPMAFFGTYKEVVPNKRIVWTNEESDQGAVTTVTLEEHGGRTLLTFHELYPTAAALEEALAGSAEGLPEQFAQLDALLAGRS